MTRVVIVLPRCMWKRSPLLHTSPAAYQVIPGLFFQGRFKAPNAPTSLPSSLLESQLPAATRHTPLPASPPRLPSAVRPPPSLHCHHCAAFACFSWKRLVLLHIDLDRAFSPIQNPSLAAEERGENVLADGCCRHWCHHAVCPHAHAPCMLPPHTSSEHARPSIPSVDRVAVSSGSARAIIQTPHPPPRSAIGNPVDPSRELTAPWCPHLV